MKFRKFKPNKTEKLIYIDKLTKLDNFLSSNTDIVSSSTRESFYFTVNGKYIRVSNHTISKSNSNMYDDLGNKIRDSYHLCKYDTEITASPLRLPEIYTYLLNGVELDKRGNPKIK
jgi:hypothetical protein